MEAKVQSEAFQFDHYTKMSGWCSYYYQIKEALRGGVDCKSFLLIGKGEGIVPLVLQYVLPEGCTVDTFDIDSSLCPTVVGDVRKLSETVQRTYDCVICCEVLEHLEWKYFEPILQEFKKVCTKRLVMSLPHRAVPFEISINVPKIRNKRFAKYIQRTWIKELTYTGEHYWEVGIRNKTRKDLLAIFNRYFTVQKEYICPDNGYHWFIIMEAKP